MKGLVFFFLAIVFSLIGWNYCSAESRQGAKVIIRKHLYAFILATLAVAVAIFLSVNTTLRLV